ncbi:MULTISPECIES: hypothetical protein [Burkholderia]|uniref:hypothetical protein n=1 Tax=Burkholderia TaxID=32008 RepID=UPI000A5FBFDE|nr:MULTISPECIES: hypothetical protein [Burkholderia]
MLVVDAGVPFGARPSGAGIARVEPDGVRELIDKGRLAESVPEWRGGALLLDARYSRRRLPAAEGRAFVDVCVEIPEAHCA